MPIEFDCPSCDKRLRIGDQSVGKRVRCPSCGTVSPQHENRVAALERWSMKTNDGNVYGPVAKPELDKWVREGRIDARCQVIREGTDRWQWATDVYPQLVLDPINGERRDGAIPVAAPLPQRPARIDNPIANRRPRSSRGYRRYSPCNRIVAGFLGIILGAFGVHRWYLGSPAMGILQLAVTFLTMGFGALWGILEGCLILAGKFNRDAEGLPMR